MNNCDIVGNSFNTNELKQLAMSNDVDVRIAVAWNKNTTSSVLDKLGDSSPFKIQKKQILNLFKNNPINLTNFLRLQYTKS